MRARSNSSCTAVAWRPGTQAARARHACAAAPRFASWGAARKATQAMDAAAKAAQKAAPPAANAELREQQQAAFLLLRHENEQLRDRRKHVEALLSGMLSRKAEGPVAHAHTHAHAHARNLAPANLTPAT